MTHGANNVSHLSYVSCATKYDMNSVPYVCKSYGPDTGTLDIIYDYSRIRSRLSKDSLKRCGEFSLWRYWDLLPVSARDPIPSLRIGWTQLYRPERLQKNLRLSHLRLKDDTGNPSGSLKDRASVLAGVRALELNLDTIVGASTGNAATSMASVCAHLGLNSYVFVPRRIPKAKLAQLIVLGTTVLSVDSSDDDCFELAWQASQKWGWYSRNRAVNPVLSEGRKTAALEICEQLNWQIPDKVFCAVGDGCIFGGLHKGFVDFHRLGLIDRIPQLIGVQAEGAAPPVKAFEQGWPTVRPQAAETPADSIRVGYPRDHVKALRAARQTQGRFISVSDEEISAAQFRIARTVGLFVEPAGATSVAGIIKMKESGDIEPDERVVALLTGHGLKDVEAVTSTMDRPPIYVECDIDDAGNKLGFNKAHREAQQREV